MTTSGSKNEHGGAINLEDYVGHLSYRMSLTRGARFQAAQRHKRRSLASMWAIIALSLYVFTSNVLVVLFGSQMDANTSSIFALISIVMSAFIIAFSVIENGHSHKLKSTLFRRNAQKISKIHDGIEYLLHTQILARGNVEQAQREYTELINEFPYNHTETDFKHFLIWKKKNDYNFFQRSYYKTSYYIACWGIMWASFLAPPFALWLLVTTFPLASS